MNDLLLDSLFEETHHLLKVLFAVHAHAVATLGHKRGLCLNTGGLQLFEEHLTLAARHHIVFLTVEDDEWRIVLIYVSGRTETKIFELSSTSSGLFSPIFMDSPQSMAVRSIGPDQSQAALMVLLSLV